MVHVGRDPDEVRDLLVLERLQDCAQLGLDAERVPLVAVAVRVEPPPRGPGVAHAVERRHRALGGEERIASSGNRQRVVGGDDLPDDAPRLSIPKTPEQPLALRGAEYRLGLAADLPPLAAAEAHVHRLADPVGNEVLVPVLAEIEHEQLREAAEVKRAVDALLAVGPDRRELEERLPAGTTERRHRASVHSPAEQTDLVLLG